MSSAVHENTDAWIHLRDVAFADASVGAMPHEKDMRQAIRLDAALLINNAAAGHSDSLHDTVDYDKVSETLRCVVMKRHYVLIESLAEHLARAVLEVFPPVRKVRIEVHKPQAVANGNVSVFVERSR